MTSPPRPADLEPASARQASSALLAALFALALDVTRSWLGIAVFWLVRSSAMSELESLQQARHVLSTVMGVLGFGLLCWAAARLSTLAPSPGARLARAASALFALRAVMTIVFSLHWA